jgi:CubicO group peptidase (beta-lactamase class C family)
MRVYLRSLASSLLLLAGTGLLGGEVQAPSDKVSTKASEPKKMTALTQRLSIIERWLDAKCAYDEIPGISLAVVKSGKVIWTHAVGVSELESQKPMTTDSVFCIASISKLFTSIALMQLRDEGLLRLDDPVSRHLDWFQIQQKDKKGGEVSLRSLLTHSSGLPREGELPYWTPDFQFPDLEQLKEMVPTQQSLYRHQDKFQYSNLGLSLAGAVVAEVSGQSYEDYISQNILTPLGMDSTFLARPEGEEAERIARGYSGKNRAGERFALDFQSAKAFTPATGFWSTSDDLAKFAAWQLRTLAYEEDSILAPNTLREMQRVHWIQGNWGDARGLGYYVDRMDDGVFVGHGGHCPGHKSQLWLQPEKELAVVALANSSASNASDLALVVLRGLRGTLASEKRMNKLVEPMAGGSQQYLGTYTRKMRGGEIQVLDWAGALGVLYLPTSNPFEGLVRFDRLEEDSFRSRSDGNWTGQLLFFQRNEERAIEGFIRSGNLWQRQSGS